MMSQTSKQELLAVLRARYQQADRKEKGRILDELAATMGYHRKYAIQVLNHPPADRKRQRRNRPRKYTKQVVGRLEELWRLANGICGKRLVPLLPTLVEALERHGELELDRETRRLLLEISPATADRLLQRARERAGRQRGRSATKPGTLLKHSIAIRTFADWDDAQPGFMEVDLVHHSGPSSQGEYVHSLDMVDVATRWSECVAIPNRSQIAVTNAMERARQRLPFPLRGVDSDNGSEFINANLTRYCAQRKITFTRARSGNKNDQAYVEQKNWTNVRLLIGYDRYEGHQACQAMNALYEVWHLYSNFFQPVMVLVSKERQGAKVSRRYDQAKTPYQRVLEQPDLAPALKLRLRHQFLTLNPAALYRQIEQLQIQVWQLALRPAWKSHEPD